MSNDQRVALLNPLDRRTFMGVSCAAIAGLATYPSMAAAGDPFLPLGRIAKSRGLRFGFALDPRKLVGLPGYADFVARQATIVVPENVMKWTVIHPAADRFDFSGADIIASFARTNGIALRGHTFCWHRALPDWVKQTVTPQTAQAVLVDHIHRVAGHYRGAIQSWDVANEVIDIDDGLPGGWRNGFWYQMLGPGFMDIAFRAAHDADPQAVLCYNEYGLEPDGPNGQAKRQAVLAVLRGMRQRGVPIGALGIQSHLRASDPHCFGPGLARFLREVKSLGLAVYITELDVDNTRLDPATSEGVVAAMYKRYCDVTLGSGTVSALLNWGVWDGALLPGSTTGQSEQALHHSLIFGSGGAIKDSSWAVEHCFERI